MSERNKASEGQETKDQEHQAPEQQTPQADTQANTQATTQANTQTVEQPEPSGAADTSQKTAKQPPAGTTTPGALFDLDPKEEKKPPAATTAANKPTGGKPSVNAPVKYPAGTEVRYQGHTLTLDKEMTAKEVLSWISEDDFPELAFEEVEMRHDKEKDRLVPVRKAQKKGLQWY